MWQRDRHRVLSTTGVPCRCLVRLVIGVFCCACRGRIAEQNDEKALNSLVSAQPPYAEQCNCQHEEAPCRGLIGAAGSSFDRNVNRYHQPEIDQMPQRPNGNVRRFTVRGHKQFANRRGCARGQRSAMRERGRRTVPGTAALEQRLFARNTVAGIALDPKVEIPLLFPPICWPKHRCKQGRRQRRSGRSF